MSEDIEWILARGSCGFNLGDRQVEAAYVNGVALFAYESPSLSRPNAPFYNCVVTGQMTCGSASMAKAKASGVYEAKKHGTNEADRRLSRKQFLEVINSLERLPYGPDCQPRSPAPRP